MNMIEQIKADRKADPEAGKGWRSSAVIWDEGTKEVACILSGRLIAAPSVCRRVSSVADMESALIAAEKLAVLVDAALNDGNLDNFAHQQSALNAFRAAIGAK